GLFQRSGPWPAPSSSRCRERRGPGSRAAAPRRAVGRRAVRDLPLVPGYGPDARTGRPVAPGAGGGAGRGRPSPARPRRPGRAALVTGRIHLQSLHTTLGLAINENEPLLLRDFQSMLERIAPQDATYLHDDFSRRVEIALDEPVNGHAHCRQLLVSGFATLL